MSSIIVDVVVFLVMNLAVFVTAVFIARRLLASWKLSEALVAVVVLASAEIVVVSTFLGVFESFSRVPLVTAVVVLGGGSLLLLRGRRLGFPANDLRFDGMGNHVIRFLVLAAIVQAVGLAYVYTGAYHYLYDDVGYHLVTAAHFVTSGSIERPHLYTHGDPGPPYYPFVVEVLAAWLMLPFHDDAFAGLVQLPFLFALVPAVAVIARELKFPWRNDTLTFATVLIVPTLAKRALVADGNLASAFFLTALVAVTLAYLRTGSAGHLVLAACALGIAAGVRYTNLLLIIPPTLFLLYALVRDAAPPTIVKHVVLVVLVSSAVGGYPYLRNLADTGTPTYPYALSLGPVTLADGPYSPDNMRGEHPFHQAFSPIGFLIEYPLGPFTAVLVGCLLAAIGGEALRRGKEAMRWRRVATYLIPVAMAGLFVSLFVYRHPPYLLAFIPLGVVGVYAIMAKEDLRRFVLPIYALTLLSTQIQSIGDLLLPFIAVLALIYGFGVVIWRGLPPFLPDTTRILHPTNASVIVVLTLFGAAAAGYASPDSTDESFPDPFGGDLWEGWKWMRSQQDPHTIAYAGHGLTYPLYGKRLQHTVTYVAVNDCRGCQHHDYWQRGANPTDWKDYDFYRRNPDFDAWRRNLRAADVDLLFLVNYSEDGPDTFPIEDAWAASHPESFTLRYKNDRVHIYAVDIK